MHLRHCCVHFVSHILMYAPVQNVLAASEGLTVGLASDGEKRIQKVLIGYKDSE